MIFYYNHSCWKQDVTSMIIEFSGYSFVIRTHNIRRCVVIVRIIDGVQ
jgi:hypothetical protein